MTSQNFMDTCVQVWEQTESKYGSTLARSQVKLELTMDNSRPQPLGTDQSTRLNIDAGIDKDAISVFDIGKNDSPPISPSAELVAPSKIVVESVDKGHMLFTNDPNRALTTVNDSYEDLSPGLDGKTQELGGTLHGSPRLSGNLRRDLSGSPQSNENRDSQVLVSNLKHDFKSKFSRQSSL